MLTHSQSFPFLHLFTKRKIDAHSPFIKQSARLSIGRKSYTFQQTTILKLKLTTKYTGAYCGKNSDNFKTLIILVLRPLSIIFAPECKSRDWINNLFEKDIQHEYEAVEFDFYILSWSYTNTGFCRFQQAACTFLIE